MWRKRSIAYVSGFRFATNLIQAGTLLSTKKAPDRKKSGKIINWNMYWKLSTERMRLAIRTPKALVAVASSATARNSITSTPMDGVRPTNGASSIKIET